MGKIPAVKSWMDCYFTYDYTSGDCCNSAEYAYQDKKGGAYLYVCKECVEKIESAEIPYERVR